MVGGNPEHDKYGFRYWEDPVSDMALRSLHNANVRRDPSLSMAQLATPEDS